MRREFRFADKIAHAFAAPQTPGAMNQFSHGPRLSVWFCTRKLPELDAVCRSGVNDFRNAAPPNDRLLVDRCQQFVREAGVRDEEEDREDNPDRDHEAKRGRIAADSARTRDPGNHCFLSSSEAK